jgi:nucleoside triphosphate pyrophosphatase
MTPVRELVLASASPRRAELLQQIGVAYHLMPVEIDESLRRGESPTDYVMRLAVEKAEAGVSLATAAGLTLPVLGADTIVELDWKVLGKPHDAEHAAKILKLLSGRSHHVHTAIALICGEHCFTALSSSDVEFADLTATMISDYVKTGEPLDKAGAYAIQGRAAEFIKRLNGSYSGVMGLPLYETASLLKACEMA